MDTSVESASCGCIYNPLCFITFKNNSNGFVFVLNGHKNNKK